MNELQIYDDFLNSDELNILNTILNTKMYNFNHKSGNREKIVTPFFSIFNTEDFFLIYMKNKIELCTRKKFNIVRHYMHIKILVKMVDIILTIVVKINIHFVYI